jgi:hypothetical protein
LFGLFNQCLYYCDKKVVSVFGAFFVRRQRCCLLRIAGAACAVSKNKPALDGSVKYQKRYVAGVPSHSSQC